MAGAPKGNTNSSLNNRLWGKTIRHAVVQSNGDRLRKIAEAMLTKAEEGDMAAIKELGDRLDGKVASSLELSGPGGSPIPVGIQVELVESKG